MAPKKTAAGKVQVKRVGSPRRREASQEATLRGLGLTRAQQVRELEDTPAIRGMIRKVAHLVQIVD